MCAGSSIAVGFVVAALILCGQYITTCRSAKGQFISTWLQTGEQVEARTIGGSTQVDRRTVAGRTGQRYLYTWNTRFAEVLHTVTIQVFPHKIAYFSSLEEAGIVGCIVLT